MSDLNWQGIVDALKTSNQNLHIWLEKSEAELSDDTLTIMLPDSLHIKTINEKYKSELTSLLNDNVAEGLQYKLEVNKTESKSSSAKITIKEEQIPLPLETKKAHIPTLNSKFRFDNFIVGDSNRFAHAACQSVAESPGQTYNPLFLYGGVGLGKTHLLHAIGTHIYENDPSKKIMIITAEKFLFEVVQNIKENKMDEFREKYRKSDLLLVDDIQFLRGDATTEEFFHTFNELYNLNKQIVATSDSPPDELNLEDRLKSRFSAGIIVDIQAPNFETRVAILKQKAKELNKDVPDNVIAYIAEHVDSNIRDLGGTFATLTALSPNDADINLDTAKQAIKMRNPKFDQDKKIGIDDIQKIVANYFNIKIQDILSKKRHENIAKARQIAMYIVRNLTDYSLVQIGQYFGGKDHTTVMHAITKVEKLAKDDEKFKTTLDELIMRVKK